MERITGLLRQSPMVGGGLLLAAVALAGLPPFGLFASEVLIATAAYRHHPAMAAAFLILLALAFSTLLAHLCRMTLGDPVAAGLVPGDRSHRLMTSALVINLAAMSVVGLLVPGFLRTLLLSMSALFQVRGAFP
jgi:hydrogenase-4 component F